MNVYVFNVFVTSHALFIDCLCLHIPSTMFCLDFMLFSLQNKVTSLQLKLIVYDVPIADTCYHNSVGYSHFADGCYFDYHFKLPRQSSDQNC